MPQKLGRLESRWVTVDGLPVHARVSVDPVPDGFPALVLVHGLGVSGRYMVPTAERLAPHFRVYAPDLPGFGRSGKPSRVLNLTELADALAGWMRAAGLERAALLEHLS
jgi:2-hydroxy-6-oxonona-2,4-dienedioate hydrolase